MHLYCTFTCNAVHHVKTASELAGDNSYTEQFIRFVRRCNPIVSQWVVHILADFIAALIPDAVMLGIQVVQKLHNNKIFCTQCSE